MALAPVPKAETRRGRSVLVAAHPAARKRRDVSADPATTVARYHKPFNQAIAVVQPKYVELKQMQAQQLLDEFYSFRERTRGRPTF